jgi:predicted dehydrogenase
MNQNRREFIRNTSLTAAGIAIGVKSLELIAANRKIISPNDMINVGVIGCNGMGWSNMRSMLKNDAIRCIALCDVDENVLNVRAENVNKIQNSTPTQYGDYRKLLENKDIDAVIIGTPDHWHCLPMIEALQADKHVYVEKPIANTIEECNLMVAAAKKYGKIVQVGQWQRSGTHYREAIDIVRSGKLGNIRLVKVWAYQGWMKPVAKQPNTPAPKGVNYDMWLGPAPKRPFNKNRFHFNFRWFWDYAGGLMTDWGVHEIDIALYAMNAVAPISVMASGGKLAYPNDASETPDTLQAIFQYKDFNMLWEHATGIDIGPYGRREGIAFIGNNGTLVLNREGYEVLVEYESLGYSKEGKAMMEEGIGKVNRPEGVSYLDLHTKNFVEALQANNASKLNTPIKSGSVAAINAQMGNIAYKTGKKLYWDATKGKFKKNRAANKLIKAKYHNGWKLPSL